MQFINVAAQKNLMKPYGNPSILGLPSHTKSYSPATRSSVSLFPSSEYLAKSKESRVLMLPARSTRGETGI